MIKEICEALTGNKKHIGLFVGGVLFGTAGLSILGSDDAKKVYTEATAAALRGKEEVMTKATEIRENCEDIYADAQKINEERAAKKDVVIQDAAAEAAK